MLRIEEGQGRTRRRQRAQEVERVATLSNVQKDVGRDSGGVVHGRFSCRCFPAVADAHQGAARRWGAFSFIALFFDPAEKSTAFFLGGPLPRLTKTEGDGGQPLFDLADFETQAVRMLAERLERAKGLAFVVDQVLPSAMLLDHVEGRLRPHETVAEIAQASDQERPSGEEIH